MDLQQLRYIVALAQERHFHRAASKMHVTQPTLSQQVKKLEEELGAPLFERSAQGVRLTQEGEKFIPYAIATLDKLALGISELQEKTGATIGKIRIAAIPTIAPYLLPTLISAVKKKAPKLRLEVSELTTSILVEHLKEDKIDLGVLSLPIPDTSIVSRSLGYEKFYLAVSKQHRLAKKKSISAKELEKEQLLILQEGHCFSDQALEYCERNRNDEQVIFQGSSLSSVMRLAETGEGVTLVPELALDTRAYPNLRFLPFSRPQPRRELGIIWRISAPLSRPHKFVMEIIEKNLRK